MTKITSAMVKELRGLTGAPMMNCKKALDESQGDFEIAKEVLRKKGEIVADKKSTRDANEGCVRVFLNDEKNQAGLVKLACETDFVCAK